MFNRAFLWGLFSLLIISNGITALEGDQSNTVRFLAEQYSAPAMPFDTAFKPSEIKAAGEAYRDPVVRAPESFNNQEYVTRYRQRRNRDRSAGQAIGGTLTDMVKDIFLLHKSLFTWNTFKIVSSVFPLFIGARILDEQLQRCFFDHRSQKNINQMPSWCHDVAKVSIAVPLVLLGSDMFFSKDNEKRWTGQIMLVGMPFVIWTKKLVKKMQFDACLRPWHEKHTKGKDRSFGGFPSGHMAQALYMAVLYGSRYGPRYALPLSALAGFIGVTFLTCNRHYLSQLVAGGAFGTIYALAASKVVEKKLTDNVKLKIAVDEVGHPTFSASMRW